MKKCIKVEGLVITIESEASNEQREGTQLELAEAALDLIEAKIEGYLRGGFYYGMKDTDVFVYGNKVEVVNELVELIKHSFWEWLTLDEPTEGSKWQFSGNKMIADIGEDDD